MRRPPNNANPNTENPNTLAGDRPATAMSTPHTTNIAASTLTRGRRAHHAATGSADTLPTMETPNGITPRAASFTWKTSFRTSVACEYVVPMPAWSPLAKHNATIVSPPALAPMARLFEPRRPGSTSAPGMRNLRTRLGWLPHSPCEGHLPDQR